MHAPNAEFLDAMKAQMETAGIETPPAMIIADCRVHRFVSKPGSRKANGWYVVHADPVAPVWWFGDWSLEIKVRGEGDPGRVLTPEENAARRKRLRDLQTKIEAEEAEFQAGAAIEALERWDRCPPAPADHDYLKSKGIAPCGVRIDGAALLTPMRDVIGKLWSLQEIWPDGRKHNQCGGRRKGCFFQIGDIGNTFCIGEGYSTCASIHMATGYAVISAGEAGNLVNVAQALRERYPAAIIIICGDDDWINGKPKNVGKLAAQEAAVAVGGVLALPWFSSARPKWATDFNDQARLSGLDDVATTIRLAMVKHQEDRERERAAEPPAPEGPEDYGFPSDGETVAFSEDALAQEFADCHLEDLRFVALWSQWLRYDTDGRWRNDERLFTFDIARKICRAASLRANEGKIRERLASAKTVAAVERMARSDQRLAAAFDQWDQDGWLLNTPAGTVNLKTGRMQRHRRKDYITKTAAVSPGGACPLWSKFIKKITGHTGGKNVETDKSADELAGFIQRMLGYALTGSTAEQCLFFIYGRGANGKSVLLSTVSSIMADFHTTAPIEVFTASQGERHPTELAGLRGARLVTAIETEEGRRWAEAKIKSLTGGDKISARFMRQDFFEFVPVFKLIIAGNHKPSLKTVDEAIRRRFFLLPFTVTIPSEERDPDLPAKLKAEWPGILKWMIDGCLAWQREGLNPPAVVRDATAAYLESEDAIAAWIEDCCIREANHWANSSALFGSWSAWAGKAGEAIGSQKAFSEKLEARGLMPARKSSGRGFQGISVRPPDAERSRWAAG